MSDAVGPDPREEDSSRRSELREIARRFNGRERPSGRTAVFLAEFTEKLAAPGSIEKTRVEV